MAEEKKEKKVEVVENYFQTLNKIDCSDKEEKKNGLSYLSWAYAWAEVKKLFPDANYKIYEREDGCIYWTDGRTAWVKTGVTICGIEHIEYLPVMDFKNKSIALNAITSFDVNKTIQRSLTKAVARHGLGLYIYAGEDLPEDAAKEQAEKQAEVKTETKAEEKKDPMVADFEKTKAKLETFKDGCFNPENELSVNKWVLSFKKKLETKYPDLARQLDSLYNKKLMK